MKKNNKAWFYHLTLLASLMGIQAGSAMAAGEEDLCNARVPAQAVATFKAGEASDQIDLMYRLVGNPNYSSNAADFRPMFKDLPFLKGNINMTKVYQSQAFGGKRFSDANSAQRKLLNRTFRLSDGQMIKTEVNDPLYGKSLFNGAMGMRIHRIQQNCEKGTIYKLTYEWKSDLSQSCGNAQADNSLKMYVIPAGVDPVTQNERYVAYWEQYNSCWGLNGQSGDTAYGVQVSSDIAQESISFAGK